MKSDFRMSFGVKYLKSQQECNNVIILIFFPYVNLMCLYVLNCNSEEVMDTKQPLLKLRKK